MQKKKTLYALFALLVTAVMLLSACTPAATPTAAPEATTAPAGTGLSVGIVLPTKDEPRWIQDETRFKDAFTKRRLRRPDPLQPG